jgi:hypothetical protein
MVENHSTSGPGDAANSLAKAVEVMKCIADDAISIATCPKCDPADYDNPATKHCRDCPRVAARVVLDVLSESGAFWEKALTAQPTIPEEKLTAIETLAREEIENDDAEYEWGRYNPKLADGALVLASEVRRLQAENASLRNMLKPAK